MQQNMDLLVCSNSSCIRAFQVLLLGRATVQYCFYPRSKYT